MVIRKVDGWKFTYIDGDLVSKVPVCEECGRVIENTVPTRVSGWRCLACKATPQRAELVQTVPWWCWVGVAIGVACGVVSAACSVWYVVYGL